MLLSSKVVLSFGHSSTSSLTSAQQMQVELLASQLGVQSGELSASVQEPTIKESLPRKLDVTPSKIERLVKINNSGIGMIEEFTSEKPLRQFGYDLFTSIPLTFAPITDAPIPSDYIIGPGDTINILFLLQG
jgi:polysaccharide export outer membrane protein